MSRKRPAKPRKAAPKGELKKPRPVWFVTLLAFVLPGSGQVLNGAPARGVIMQFGMVFAGYVSYQLTTPEISPIGRVAGGLLVWVFSIVDANGIANRRVKAWARIEAEQAQKASQGAKGRSTGAGKSGTAGSAGPKGGTRRASASRAVRREPLAAGAGSGGAANPSISAGGAGTAPEPPGV